MEMSIDRGGSGSAGFTIIELMIVVAIMSVLAAIAIPSYVKYVRRSKTMEASLNVRKLYDSSVAYYQTDHADRAGAILPRQFPGNGQIYTPGTTCCLAAGSVAGKCVPGPTLWDDEIWFALNFGEHDPFYFQYGYASSGTDTTAAFRAGAYGDLDCDDIKSTFERTGHVASDRSVTGGFGMYVNNDIE